MADGGPNEVFRRHESPGTKTFAVTDDPPVFVRGAGARLVDTYGRTYLDFASGSGSTVLGHGHPAVLDAVARQATSGILHVGPHFHVPVQAAFLDRLLGLLPDGLDMLQPATNGTEATEAALKIAMHATGRRRFMAFEGAYHGRTLGALAVSPSRGANAALEPLRPEVVILPYPVTAADVPALADALENAGGDFAGLLVEPIQATAGMRALAPEAVAVLSRHAARHAIPLIVDEVFTAFGRTGALFASPGLGLEPDLLVLAKSLGGGIPAGLVAGRRDLVGRLPAGAQSSTFQLHPLAAATGLAMLETLVGQDLPGRARAIGRRIDARADALAAGPGGGGLLGVAAVRGVAIAGPGARARTRAIRRTALESGLVTWECGLDGEVIGLVPPLVVTDDEIDAALDILVDAIRRTP